MTAQCRERLIYNGEEYYLATEPLASYLIKHDYKVYCSTYGVLERVYRFLAY